MASVPGVPWHARPWRLVSDSHQLKEPPEGLFSETLHGGCTKLGAIVADTSGRQLHEAGLADGCCGRLRHEGERATGSGRSTDV